LSTALRENSRREYANAKDPNHQIHIGGPIYEMVAALEVKTAATP